jgi:hypothetical protein
VALPFLLDQLLKVLHQLQMPADAELAELASSAAGTM